MSTELEPIVHGLGANLRADIKVTFGAQSWLLDVGIVCPATATHVAQRKSNVTPGAAGRHYYQIKHQKYQGKVTPIIIETGGRFEATGRDFIDKLAADAQEAQQRPRTSTQAHKVFNAVARRLERQQMHMMSNLVREIAQPDAGAAQPPHRHSDEESDSQQ